MMTVKQIADKAGVSKTTVTRYLKRMENTIGTEYVKHNTSTDELGRMIISEELAEKLKETILKQKELQQGTTQTTTVCNTDVSECSETDCNSTATRRNTELKQGATSEIINTLNRLIETQQAQIEQLNRTIDQYQQDKHDLKEQLAVKDNQIEQLNILLSQQQQLHQTLQVKLLETELELTQDEAEPTVQHKKKGLFGIFKKK